MEAPLRFSLETKTTHKMFIQMDYVGTVADLLACLELPAEK